MGVDAEQVVSQGDVLRRLRTLEKEVERLHAERRLESATIGAGGLRVKGGHIVIQDAAGNETMRLATDGLTLTGLLRVLGTIEVTGNSIVVLDSAGAEIFRAGSAGLTLQGVMQVLGALDVSGDIDLSGTMRVAGGSIEVAGGGNITVTGGQLVASDGQGEVFAVDPSVPRINMRKALVADLVDDIVQELLTSSSGRTLVDGIVEDLLVSPAGQTLAAWVIGQRVRHGEGVGIVTVNTEDVWTTGSGGTVPTVSNVPVSSSGVALVWVAAQCSPHPVAGETGTAYMSFQVSGATSRSPDLSRSAGVGRHGVSSGDTVLPGGRVGALITLTGLNEGLHTFAGRFQHVSGGSGGSNFASFSSMAIAVMGL